MRTLTGMFTAEIVLMVVLLIFITGLLLILYRFNKMMYDQMQQLAVNVQTDRAQQERLEATLDRMERHTGVVARDLAETIERADAADEDTPGAAADAAHRTAP